MIAGEKSETPADARCAKCRNEWDKGDGAFCPTQSS